MFLKTCIQLRNGPPKMSPKLMLKAELVGLPNRAHHNPYKHTEKNVLLAIRELKISVKAASMGLTQPASLFAASMHL